MGTDESNETTANHPISSPNLKKTGFWHSVREWAQVIVIALIIAAPIRMFIAEPFIVNGASMDPTFTTGQFLVVDRLSYRFQSPERGDVIVFEYPNDPSVYYIKRIIGLPGESVVVQNGKVSIRTASSSELVPLDEPYIDGRHASRDTFTMKPLTSEEYFVMGDNRLESSDSRVWGPLPYKLIVGRPMFRLTPFNKIEIMPGQYNETKTP